MTDDQLRCVVLDHVTQLKKLMLREQSARIVSIIRDKDSATPADVAKIIGKEMSATNASMLMQTLVKKGYLRRDRLPGSHANSTYFYVALV